MSDVVDLYAALRDDEAWWDTSRPHPPVELPAAAEASHPSGPDGARFAHPQDPPPGDHGGHTTPPDSRRGPLREVEGHLALEALGALVADAHLRREHWELAQRAHRRHDSRACLEDCLAVLAIDPNHREARKLGAKTARNLREWAEAASLLTDLLQDVEPAGQLDWDRIVAATVAGDDEGVRASVARLGLDPWTWEHPEALILVMLDGRAQVARRIGPAAAEILSIAAGDRPQHVGDVVAFDPTPLPTGTMMTDTATDPAPSTSRGATCCEAKLCEARLAGATGRETSSAFHGGSTFAEVASTWPPPPPGTPAAPLPPPSLVVPMRCTDPTADAVPRTIVAAPHGPPSPPTGPRSQVTAAASGSPAADMPSWPTFRTLAILASGARQAWIVKGIDPGFEAWDDTVAELRERGWVLRRVPTVDTEGDDRLGVVALPAALDPSEVRAALKEATSAWPVPPSWQNQR